MKQARVFGLATGQLVIDEHGNRIEERALLGDIIKKKIMPYHSLNELTTLVNNGEEMKSSVLLDKALKSIERYHERVDAHYKKRRKQ